MNGNCTLHRATARLYEYVTVVVRVWIIAFSELLSFGASSESASSSRVPRICTWCSLFFNDPLTSDMVLSGYMGPSSNRSYLSYRPWLDWPVPPNVGGALGVFSEPPLTGGALLPRSRGEILRRKGFTVAREPQMTERLDSAKLMVVSWALWELGRDV